MTNFKCHIPTKPATLNLFNKVIHFSDASGFDVAGVEIYAYYKTIAPALIQARMTYLCEKYKVSSAAGDVFHSFHHDRMSLSSLPPDQQQQQYGQCIC